MDCKGIPVKPEGKQQHGRPQGGERGKCACLMGVGTASRSKSADLEDTEAVTKKNLLMK